MDARAFHATAANDAERYCVTLTLDVADVQALWTAAAERALQAPGMTLGDVLDTIGPREDPSVADCLALLAIPTLPGCALDDLRIRSIEHAGTTPVAVPCLPAPAVRSLPFAAAAGLVSAAG